MADHDPIITLTTDFGDRDGFVGTMKGVILSISPGVRIVDISHNVPRQDVFAGAMVLGNAAPYFPAGTIHVAVVDPGVGSNRKALVAENELGLFVLPDNGLVTMIDDRYPMRRVNSVENTALCLPNRSQTFHGRDIFAPVAAHLAKGAAPETAGPLCSDPIRLPTPKPSVREQEVLGEIVYEDTFGNLFTNIDECAMSGLTAPLLLEIGDMRLGGPSNAYADAKPGQPLFLMGSSGFLEIAVNGGNAATVLGFGVGTRLRLRPVRFAK